VGRDRAADLQGVSRTSNGTRNWSTHAPRAWSTNPASLDTIVATNLHADILSDLAAALAGSLGIAPTGNIDPERRYPSMFEPIHGSAFDIMGKGLANPVGTFWSVVMLLEHLGETEAAKRVMQAIEKVTADKSLHTRDLGGTATTAQVTRAVCDQVAGNMQRKAA
jgi:tartrate dehydrogenase/decarboxylase/D-malate dehydrogenase